MTKDQQEDIVKKSLFNTQQPFQVVLIDIGMAANGDIYCVQKPLSKDLQYVAISYRWGEIQETTIDTQVGYLASVTSFDLQDFYKLCATIKRDASMTSIQYVWVDAICVNQSNYEQRKATVYHMTEIYEHATYILAVPDLYAAYLRAHTVMRQAMQYIRQHQTYLYYLIHGDTTQLYAFDEAFLDTLDVPKDPPLRQLLTKYTDCFTDSFMNCEQHAPLFNPIHIMDHLYDLHHHPSSAMAMKDDIRFDLLDRVILNQIFGKNISQVQETVQSLHHCDDTMHCPLKFIPMMVDMKLYNEQPPALNNNNKTWSTPIYQRSVEIRQAMHFLIDLLTDWSSRVWVMSEFHISKKKNNLKFWFTQLTPMEDTAGVAFFEFDTNDPKLTILQNTPNDRALEMNLVVSDPVYVNFHQHLIRQLNEQLFLEMILKSKASKNEDRFYAIMPLFSEYKQLLQNDVVKQWHIDSLLSVKLTLYNIMTRTDKILLFYLSACGDPNYTLPTFATSTIDWQYIDDRHVRSDFHLLLLNAPSDITIHEWNGLHYLHVKLQVYCRLKHPHLSSLEDQINWDRFIPHRHKRQVIFKWLQLDEYALDVVTIPWLNFIADKKLICLIGNFKKNVWIFANAFIVDFKYGDYYFDYIVEHDFDGFHIY